MKIKINSSNPISLIKLNYRCKEEEQNGIGPGSCSNNVEKSDNKIDIKKTLSSNDHLKSIISDVISNSKSDHDLMTSDASFLGMEVGVRPSDTFKKIAAQYGIKSETPLKRSFDLVTNVSKGDQDSAREQIYAAFENSGDLKKALEIQMEVETRQLLKNDITLYRKGGYHENTIESYTTNSKGANMKWMTNPDEHIGTDFGLSPEKLIKDGWKVLSGVQTRFGFVGESEVILINTKDIESKNIKRSYDPEEAWDRIESSARAKDAREYESKLRKISIYSNKVDDTPIKIDKPEIDQKIKIDTLNKLSEQFSDDRPFYGDPVREGFQHLLKFDAPPKIVSKDYADKLISEGNIELLYINTPEDDSTYKTGVYNPTIEGMNVLSSRDGIAYTDLSKKIKTKLDQPYNAKSVVSRLVFSKDAKIITDQELQKLSDDINNKQTELHEKYRNDVQKIYKDYHNDPNLRTEIDKLDEKFIKESNDTNFDSPELRGSSGKVNLAMILGYDAIQHENYPNFSTTILNRGAVYIQKDPIPASEKDSLVKYIDNQQEKQQQAWIAKMEAEQSKSKN